MKTTSIALAGLTIACFMPLGSAAEGLIHTLVSSTGNGSQFGRSMSNGGDVDGDGFPDLIIGDPFYPVGPLLDAGRVEVISGRDGTLIMAFDGPGASDWFGYSCGGGGLVDGDNVPDIIVGSPLHGTNDQGAVYVYSGATGALIHTFLGSAGSKLGWSVSNAGDFDGDSRADVIAGAPNDTSGGSGAGSATVFSGLTGVPLLNVTGTADDHMGQSVSGDANISAFGHSEVIIGSVQEDCPGMIDAGAIYVYSLHLGVPVEIHHVCGTSGLGNLGFAVDNAGDVNGDGVDDFIGGAPQTNGSNNSIGAVLVYSGINGALLEEIRLNNPKAYLGASVAGTGDANGDGFADVILGEAGWDTDTGRFHVVSGASLGTGSPVYLMTVEGSYKGEQVGYTVEGIDINQDNSGDAASFRSTGTGTVDVFTVSGGSAIAFGAGCAGPTGVIPTFQITGCIAAGTDANMSVEKGPAGGLVVMLLGPQPAAVPIGAGCTLYAGPVAIPIPLFPLSGAGPANGSMSLDFGIPMTSAGTSFVLQAFIASPSSPIGMIATNAVEVEIL